MAINAKSKGNRFEIEICRKLSNFLTNNIRDDLFWRTSNSGGRQTVRYKKGIDTHNQDSDITATHPDGEYFISTFSIECKKYKDIGLWSIITNVRGNTIAGWWEVHIKKSIEVNKQPILIVKQNHRPTLFICNHDVSVELNKIIVKSTTLVSLNNSLPTMYIYKFDELLNVNVDEFNILMNRVKL